MKFLSKSDLIVFKSDETTDFITRLETEIRQKLIFYFGSNISSNNSQISFSRQPFYNFRDRLQAIDSGDISIETGLKLYKLSYRINMSGIYILFFIIFLIIAIPALIVKVAPFYIVIICTIWILLIAPVLAGLSEVSFYLLIKNCIRRAGGSICAVE